MVVVKSVAGNAKTPMLAPSCRLGLLGVSILYELTNMIAFVFHIPVGFQIPVVHDVTPDPH